MNAVSDSDVVIAWLRGIPEAKRTLEAYERVFVSFVTWIEVLTGARTPERDAATRSALRAFEMVPISIEIAERAIAIRRAGRMKLPDAVILATARQLNCVLLTRNAGDFRADEPDVQIPYRL